MNPTKTRIKLLSAASQHPAFAQLIGTLSETDLTSWLQSELGTPQALDQFSKHGDILSKAIPPNHILHIVSGNTPHAAIQSLLRGLLLGSHNTVKLPSVELPDFTAWVASLPEELSSLVTLENDMDAIQWDTAAVVVAIGSDTTINSIQTRILPHQTFIPHGHKISIGIITQPSSEAAELAARDISLYDQRGCLSLHAVYVDETDDGSAREFADTLAHAMAEFAKHTPPQPMTLSEAGAIHNFRETTRFLAANSQSTDIIESPESLDWTVVYQDDPTLHLSCLGRCVHVKPLPSPLDLHTIGREAQHLSTITLHPFSTSSAEKFTHLPAHRICPMGTSQSPSLFWHHDGYAPLASMVKWQDIG